MTSNQDHPEDVKNILAKLKEIAETVMYATEARTLREVLRRIAIAARQTVRSRYAALGVPDGRGGLRYFEVAGMTVDEIALLDHPPVGRGLLGVIMNERTSLRLERISDDPRSVGFPKNHPTMTSLLGVPIQVGQQLFGMLYLCDREDGQPFSEQDQWLVESLAGYAALAIAGVYLSEQQSRLTLLEERERVGMELHDGIIQSLYAIGMQLQLMRLSGENQEDGFTQAIRSLDNVIEDIRRYILNLRSAVYHHQTITQALQDTLTRLHVPPDLSIQVHAPQDHPPLEPPVLEALCQITQEAVSNVIRHAAATEVVIQVNQQESLLQLVIRDDGQGFDLDATANHEGLGLRNIQQRARIQGGRATVRSAPGEGTELVVSIPF